MKTTTTPAGEKLSGRLTDRRRTRRIRHHHARIALQETIAHQGEIARILRSGDAVALRLEATRRLVLAVLMPALLCFGAWSTAGVQAGAAAMTHAATGSPMWWALWALEPALIAIVAVVVLVRVRLLGAVQGDDAHTIRDVLTAAERLMWGALAVSLVLNTVGHWPDTLSGAGALLFHALGPIGAAATVHLIGVLLEAVEAVPIPEAETADTLDSEDEENRSTEPEPVPELPSLASGSTPSSVPTTTSTAESTAPTGLVSPPVAEADPLLDYAAQVADVYQQTYGQPISAEALRDRLGVADAVAARLHAQLVGV